MIKQKPEGRRPKEERRRKKEETEQEGWWTSQLRSPVKGLPPRDSPWCVLEATSRDRSRPGAHGEPSGCGEVISLPFPPIVIASLRTVCQRCCTPPQKIEVLHLFRCSTYTHTHTHAHTHTHPFPVWGTEHLSGGWVSPGVSLGYRRSYRQELDVNFQDQRWKFEEFNCCFHEHDAAITVGEKLRCDKRNCIGHWI